MQTVPIKKQERKKRRCAPDETRRLLKDGWSISRLLSPGETIVQPVYCTNKAYGGVPSWGDLGGVQWWLSAEETLKFPVPVRRKVKSRHFRCVFNCFLFENAASTHEFSNESCVFRKRNSNHVHRETGTSLNINVNFFLYKAFVLKLFFCPPVNFVKRTLSDTTCTARRELQKHIFISNFSCCNSATRIFLFLLTGQLCKIIQI